MIFLLNRPTFTKIASVFLKFGEDDQTFVEKKKMLVPHFMENI